MLILFPLAALLGLFLVFQNLDLEIDWRRAVLRAAVGWGVILVLLTEILSLVSAITPLGLVLGWSLPIMGSALFLARRWKSGAKIRLLNFKLPESWWDRGFLVAISVIVATTALVAWYTPPQTWDSLNYHLARIGHWAQQQAVRHYVTGIEVQNSMPPGAEMIGLHVYVLSAGDRLATFVQWFAMLGSLVGVSYVARQLGAGYLGQLMATVFTATIPMGIVQASSTVTDYVMAFWMLCTACEAISVIKGERIRSSVVMASMAAGLGLVTKPTAVAYVSPFTVMIALALLRRWSIGKFFRYTLLAAGIVFIMNIGHLSRNYNLFGNPIASTQRISTHMNQVMNLKVLISNTLRNASLQAATPSPHVNKGIYLFVAKVHELMDMDLEDRRITLSLRYKVSLPTTNEDRTSNPLHAYLILIVFVALILKRRVINRTLLITGLTIAGTFLVFSLLVKWEVFNVRLHLPFFVLYAPVIGIMLTNFLSTRTVRLIGVIFFVASWPWLVGIQSRPLISNSSSFVDSILEMPREDLYFVNGWDLMQPYREMTEIIQLSGCPNVGILIPGNGAEYSLWVLFNAPRDAPRVEWMESGGTSRYTDPNFTPCTVICQRCKEEQKEFNDLPLFYEHRPTQFKLFLSPEYALTPSGES